MSLMNIYMFFVVSPSSHNVNVIKISTMKKNLKPKQGLTQIWSTVTSNSQNNGSFDNLVQNLVKVLPPISKHF